VSVPTQSLDLLWKNYEGFEAGLGNKQLARKLLDEQRPRWVARAGGGGGGGTGAGGGVWGGAGRAGGRGAGGAV
jgi:hypothetical protein